MTYSRRQLYAAGEPLGECVTVPKAGGGYVCGAGASGSSLNGDGGSSDNSNKTSNTDRSLSITEGTSGPVTADGNSSIVISRNVLAGDNSTYNILDAGAIQAASKNTEQLILTTGQLGAQLMATVKAQQDWASHLVDGVNAQTQSAMQTVASVVSKPLDMQDPKNIMVVIGIIVVGVVAVTVFKKG